MSPLQSVLALNDREGGGGGGGGGVGFGHGIQLLVMNSALKVGMHSNTRSVFLKSTLLLLHISESCFKIRFCVLI